jgi:glycosyltransferase involved in cell wall biosynthesis
MSAPDAARGRHAGVTLKVLQLFRSLDPAVGGPVAYLRALIQAVGTSAEVAVAAFEPHAPDVPVSWAFRGPAGLRGLPAVQLGCWLRSHAGDYDVVHIHGMFGWHALLGRRACLRRGVPYVLSPHGHLQDNALRQKSLKKLSYLAGPARRLLADAAAVIATSGVERRAVLSREAGARVRVVPPGIACSPPPPHEMDSTLRLLYLGRLHPHKQIPVLLDALAKLAAEGLACRLTIAGSGGAAHEDELRAMAGRTGAPVHFAGHVDATAKRELFARTDLLVLPSLSENFSFAVAEALAAGVPAVVTEEVGLAEAIERQGCGAVVPVGDAAALARAIASLSAPDRRGVLRARARACAAHELAPERMRDALLEVYRDAAAGRR